MFDCNAWRAQRSTAHAAVSGNASACSTSPAPGFWTNATTRRRATRLRRQGKRERPFHIAIRVRRRTRAEQPNHVVVHQARAGVLTRLHVRRESVVGQRHVEDGAFAVGNGWHPGNGLDRDRSALWQRFERYLRARRLRAKRSQRGRAAPLLPLREIAPLHQNLRRVDEARAIRTHSLVLPFGIGRCGKAILPAQAVPVVDMKCKRNRPRLRHCLWRTSRRATCRPAGSCCTLPTYRARPAAWFGDRCGRCMLRRARAQRRVPRGRMRPPSRWSRQGGGR